MELDNGMKALLRDLGKALHRAMSSSDEILDITNRIRGNGYDVYLILEANILLDKREDKSEGKFVLKSRSNDFDEEEFALNDYDASFLADLKIRLDE